MGGLILILFFVLITALSAPFVCMKTGINIWFLPSKQGDYNTVCQKLRNDYLVQEKEKADTIRLNQLKNDLEELKSLR